MIFIVFVCVCVPVCLWVYVSVRYKKRSTWLFYSSILHLWNKFSHGRCSLPFHVAWLGSEALFILYCWVYIHAEPYLLWCGCWGSTPTSSGLYIKHFTHLPRPVNVVVFTNFIILVLFSDIFLLKLNTWFFSVAVFKDFISLTSVSFARHWAVNRESALEYTPLGNFFINLQSYHFKLTAFLPACKETSWTYI